MGLIFYDCLILKLGSDDSAVYDSGDVSFTTPACLIQQASQAGLSYCNQMLDTM